MVGESMACGISSEDKIELCKKMASNLATLRTKANIKQDDLADRLGLSRQTISAIENNRRVMEWSTFSVLAMFFSRENQIRKIMCAMELLDDNICEILKIPVS
jgi:DNA-binding XRE family transcriptional regulator